MYVLARSGCFESENFGGGRLPLECFLRFVEQPYVLDRNHRLVGEGPQQRKLLFRIEAGCHSYNFV